MSAATDLASAGASLEDVMHRVTEVAVQLEGTEREDLTNSLHEVERLIRNAVRRLDRVVADLGG